MKRVNSDLKDKVALITGANNPWDIGVTTALAFAREGANVVLVYKKIARPFDASKIVEYGADRYMRQMRNEILLFSTFGKRGIRHFRTEYFVS